MLELNMLAFLGVLSLTQRRTYPSSLKYFIVQRLGSRAFLFGLLMTLLLRFSRIALRVVRVSLFLKLGAAPLHG
jgi:NADH:ubiquinone oxidoreductase subunit 2 (subunit N)